MELLVGYGQREITPSPGIELCGHGFYCERKATGILEPIYARALAWAYGTCRGVILELEVLCLPRRRVLRIKELIGFHFGVPADRIIVACLHNHSAPSTCDMMGYGEPNEEYIADFTCRSAGAALDAFGRLRPAALEYAALPVAGIGINREQTDGPTDPELRLLRFTSDGKLFAFLANYACHPVVLNRGTFQVSSDFIGIALNDVCRRHGIDGLFLQGACGDINSLYVNCPESESLGQVRELSDRFAAYLEEALFTVEGEGIAVNQVRMVTREVNLPLQQPDRMMLRRHLRLIRLIAPYGDSLPKEVRKELLAEKAACQAIWDKINNGPLEQLVTEMQALRWGNFLLAAQPAELFYRYQAEVFQSFDRHRMMLAGYANDYVGYIPSPDQYEMDTAAASWVPFVLKLPLFRSDIGAIFTRHLIDTVEAVID